MRKLISLLALVLVFAMALSLAACQTPPAETGGNNGGDGGNNNSGNGGNGGNKDTTGIYDTKYYTYRMAPADLPEHWNVQTYQSNSSTYVLDYTSDSLYGMDYNDDYTGFKIVTEMAKEFPIDVTKDYVGKYGVKAGDENKVYKIVLKDYLTYDNGDKLDAYSFVESMKCLLNPVAANYRADNVYKSGSLKIYNAEAYLKQSSYALSAFVSENYGDDEYVDPSLFTKTEAGTLQHNGFDIVLDINDGSSWGADLYSNIGSNVYNDDQTQVALWDVATEEIVAWRTLSKVGEGDAAAYVFYDLEGNEIEVGLNESKTAYVWGEKTLDFALQYPEAAERIFAAVEAAAAAPDGKLKDGQVYLTESLLKDLQDCIAMLHGHADVEAYAAEAGDYAYQEFEEMVFLGTMLPAMEYDGNVGFFATSPTELVIALINPMEDNFYLRYELMSSFFLVHVPTYKKCEKVVDGIYTNTYGTSVDTFVGFGPYKLTQYVEGATIRLERNDKWRGYAESDYISGTYQTDAINYQKVTNEATRLEMFLKGEIDSYGLQPEDMDDYLGSDYTYFNDSESTWFLVMNPDAETLAEMATVATPEKTGNTVIKTPVAITEFRQALSYSLNRTEFNQLLSPTSGVAKALLSSMIVADPESGMSYRSSDEAKDAILSFWGLSDKWGPGKEYETRDEAIDSITGYDPAGAKALFNTAYDKAVEAGYITDDMISSGNWEVQLCIGKPAEASFYNKGFEFLKTCWTNAIKGTKFEGHVTFVLSQTLGSTSFGNYLRNGQVDILFGVGYGGSMFDPYSMMDCFTGNLQYDPFTDKTEVMVDVELDGKVLRASLYDWVSEALQGNTIECGVVGADGKTTGEVVKISAGSSAPAARRITILAAAEEAVLNLSNIFPLQTDASASLRCMRVNYKTEEYILGVGRGGTKYYTYAMDDAEFAAYVTKVGGTLNYK